MSERPVEDEIIAETTSFAAKLSVLARQHAQARGWWDQRKVRREISLTMRKQRRQEQADRAHHLSWTSQMIHRYQVAEQSRRDRIGDPRTSAEERRRAEDSGARHIEELRERIVGNTRLTQVERGVALDCLDSARMWPNEQAKTPEMLVRASKIRGVNALRYRARLAREAEWVQQRRRERETGQQFTSREPDPMPVRVEHDRLVAPGPAHQEPVRPTGELTLAQTDAIHQIRHARLTGTDAGQARRAAVAAGLTEQRADWEFRTAEQNSRFTSEVAALRNGEITTWRTYHPSEAEATQWAAHNAGASNWLPGVQLKATIRERGNEVPVRVASGDVEHVTARTAEWIRPESARETEEMASLKQRHYLSIEHNADLAEKNATLTQQLTALRAERDGLVQELNHYKSDRAEAVDQAKRDPIPGHAFSGLVNGHDREREGMER